jgi:signal transduction histidine kinase
MMDIAFEQLYRLPTSSSSGLGLGLAIARTIAEVHNGRLEILNHPKGGMIFSLHLPMR